MIENKAGSKLGRAYTWLAAWYALACGLPTGLLVYLRKPEDGSTPGFSYVNDSRNECAGQLGCPTEPADIGTLVQQMLLVLAPTLLVAVPLCVYLERKWKRPALAGTVAAFTGWIVLCAGGFIYHSI